jgi:hypothetical protein
MGKIKAKQLALVAAFVSGTGGALDLADEGIAASKLAGNIGADKLSQALLNQIVTGQRQRESVLVEQQLLGSSGAGVAPATVIKIATNPNQNENIYIKNSEQTENFVFKNAEAAAFDVLIGANADETAANLAAAINADSAGWSAVVKTNLDAIAGTVVIIYRKTTTAGLADRVYKLTGGGLRTVNFAGGRYDATVSSEGVMTAIDADNLTTLSPSDPATATFGFGRVAADLIDGDLRFVMAGGASYVYDADAAQWDNAGAAIIGEGAVGVDEISSAIAGAGLLGGSGSALSVNVDDTGIEISSDALRLKDGGVSAGKLGTNAVTTAKIADANVTTAKLADDGVTTAKILDANVTTAKLADANVTTAKIADANVTTAKLADDGVTTAKILDANVTTAKLADANVTTAKIADANVTAAKLASDAVTTAKILDANVTTAKLADANVTTAKLAATCVTAAKLGSDVAGNGLTGGNGAALAVLAANTSVNVATGGVKAAVPVLDDKARAPSGAVTTDEATTGLTITKTPAAGSYIRVSLNGVGVELGGDKTKDCYFSDDGGTTARALASVVAGDTLYWNAVISGVNLSTDDEIDFDYLNTTA